MVPHALSPAGGAQRELEPGRVRSTDRRTLLSAGFFASLTLGAGGCTPGNLRSVDTAAEPLLTPVAGAQPTSTVRVAPPSLVLLPNARSLPGRLLFVSDADIWLAERGQARRLTPDRISRYPSWSIDGSKIALVKVYANGSDIWIMDADGSNSVELTDFSYREEKMQNYALRPVWWPDGARLIYLSQEGTQDTQLWQLTLSNRRRQRFLPAFGDGSGGIDTPKLSPDGRTLAVASFEPAAGAAGPVELAPRSQIWTYALPAGPTWRRLTTITDGAYDPAWAPDGRRLAYISRNVGRHDVWVMGADGANARQITTAGACRAPVWSPDSAWLAYLSAQTGTFEVWVTPAPPDPSVAGAAGVTAPLSRQITRNGLVEAASGLAWAR